MSANRQPQRSGLDPFLEIKNWEWTMRRTLVFVVATAFLQLSANATKITTQLPTGVTPSHYALSVTPDASTMTLRAHVDIHVLVAKRTSTMMLNAVNLKFAQVLLTDVRAGKTTPVRKIEMLPQQQAVKFYFDRQIAAGDYLLSIDYDGRIGTQASGLFALSYDSPTGIKKALYTQFENSEARRLFPSWDEPNYKATFSLEANVSQGDMAVSNMPIEARTDLGNGLVRLRFATTPRMSTYLLFLASGDFERVTTQLGNTELGVVTKRGSAAQATDALDASRLVLAEYNHYFDVPYPLPKLDNVAAPGRSQFFSAMENWGAIFSFEGAMLIDPKIATASDRQRVFSVAAHEIAHQWFGNLVTMQWWDDLWLNEGFASWMESRTTAKLHPEWNSPLNDVQRRSDAMEQDALKTTHPVVQKIRSVEQASQAFDGITYKKGQAVISMLETYVGADVWREGVRSYMRQYAYANTRSNDFWRHINQAAGQPVNQIADDFTLQPGVPLIQVGKGQCKNGKLMLSLTQGEFSHDQRHKKPRRWHVPVTIKAVGSPKTSRTVIATGRGRLTLPSCDLPVVNAGQTGYFRTLYPSQHLRALTQQFNQLPAADQLGLLLDSWELGAAGLQPASNYLDLVQAVAPTADPKVWSEISVRLSRMHRVFESDSSRQLAFDKFAIAKLNPLLAELGWIARVGDSHGIQLLRQELIQALNVLGDPVVVAEARRRYAAQYGDPTAVPAELRRTLLAVVARHADVDTWERLHTDAMAEKTPLIKDLLYGLLATTLDPTLAQRALDLSLQDEVGETNSAAMISHVSDLHPELAFDFAMSHLPAINSKVDSASRSRFYPALAVKSAQTAMLKKLKAYANRHLAAGSRRSAEQAAAIIANRIANNRRIVPSLGQWLARHKS